MRSEAQVREVVHYVLIGHDIEQTASHFTMSKRTINRILDEVRLESGKYYNEKLAQDLKTVLDRFLSEARAKAGASGRRKNIVSDKEAYQMILDVLREGLTLRSLAEKYNCSHTSVANAIKRVADSDTLLAIDSIRNDKGLTISEREHLNNVLTTLMTLSQNGEITLEEEAEIRDVYKKSGGR